MTPIQHSVIVSLYELEMGEAAQWYVKTRALKTSVIKSLYKIGMIEADKAYNNVPTRFKLSEKGRDYGRHHYTGIKSRIKPKSRLNEVRDRYDHYDLVARRSNDI